MTQDPTSPSAAAADLEEALDEAEERFYTVFDVNPAPALIVRLFDERVELVNSGICELLGYRRGELRHRSLHELELFTDPPARERLLDAPRRFEEVSRVEIDLNARGDERKTVLASAKALEYNDQLCAILTFADITDQKQAEAHFATMFRVSPTPSCLLSTGSGRFVEVNTRFLELSGFNRAEVLHRTPLELKLWSPAALPGEAPFRDHDLELRTKSGEVRDVQASAAILDDDTDMLLLMLHDVTERRQTERQLTQAIGEVMQDAQLFSHLIIERLTRLKARRGDERAVVTLSPRERQVLQGVARGLNNDAIAAELGIAAQTVRNYISAIYTKLELRSRAEAVVWARERGLGGG
jgi:PAS domain S-box-containing protein